MNVEVRVITTNLGLDDLITYQKEYSTSVNGVPVFYYPADNLCGLTFSQSLIRDLDAHLLWADLIHMNSIWQPLGIAIQKRAYRLGVPVIQALRGALSPYSWSRGYLKKIIYYHLFEKVLLQRAAAIHCTAQNESDEVQSLSLRPPVKLLPNPIDQTYLRYEPHIKYSWRKFHGLPTDQPLLLVAGRIHHKKGLDLLPRILYELRHKPWHILFIGEDDDGTAPKLKRIFSHLNLSHRCHWMTTIPANELINPYNSADWLLLPSRHENFGNVVIEALACGCGALVTTNVGVSTDLLRCPGFFAASRNHQDFKAIVSAALDTHRPGDLSSHWISNIFSISSIANKALALYAEVLRK